MFNFYGSGNVCRLAIRGGVERVGIRGEDICNNRINEVFVFTVKNF